MKLILIILHLLIPLVFGSSIIDIETKKVKPSITIYYDLALVSSNRIITSKVNGVVNFVTSYNTYSDEALTKQVRILLS